VGGSGYGFLLTPRALLFSGSDERHEILRTGPLAVMEAGTEQATSVAEYELGALQRVLVEIGTAIGDQPPGPMTIRDAVG
jgi:hypothetical protein